MGEKTISEIKEELRASMEAPNHPGEAFSDTRLLDVACLEIMMLRQALAAALEHHKNNHYD